MIRVDGEKLAKTNGFEEQLTLLQNEGLKIEKWLKETPEEELKKLFAENMYELCMETLKEGDCDLKLTGKCKKCYDYAAEQFILNYISGKSMFDVMDDIRGGRFYNTWKGFLYGAKYVVVNLGKFHGSLGRGIETVINNSRISRKVWIKFLDYYFSER